MIPKTIAVFFWVAGMMLSFGGGWILADNPIAGIFVMISGWFITGTSAYILFQDE